MSMVVTGRRCMVGAMLTCTIMATPVFAGRTPGEVEIGQTLREAPLIGLNSPARKLSSYRGKPLIINVWASWCGPCKQETASLERLAWLDPGGHFAMIGISTDDYPEKARAWLRQSNATINHYIDDKLMLEHMLGATNLPLTVLVDANGRVIEKIYGAREWDSPQSLQLIRKAFRNPKIAPGR